jgi:hypothetical protein
MFVSSPILEAKAAARAGRGVKAHGSRVNLHNVPAIVTQRGMVGPWPVHG